MNEPSSALAAEVCNAATGAATKALLYTVKGRGLSNVDLLIALEGVVASIFLAVVKLGGDEPVLESFVEGVRERLAIARLRDQAPEGEA